MDIQVYYQGKEAGKLTLRPEGLYYALEAICDITSKSILRLYGIDGMKSVSLGVMQPEGDKLTLRRRLSAKSLGAIPEYAVAGQEIDGYLPWRGEIADREIPVAYIKTDGARETLAIPYRSEEAYPFPDLLMKTGTTELGGESYLTLELTQGEPEWVSPEPEQSEAEQDKLSQPQPNKTDDYNTAMSEHGTEQQDEAIDKAYSATQDQQTEEFIPVSGTTESTAQQTAQMEL